MNKPATFKEIQIGGMGKDELLKRLETLGIKFNEYAKTLFEHPSFSPPAETQKVKLVKLSLRELRLEESCTYNEYVSKASELGLSLCPLYLAAFLRLDYLNQVEGPYLTIASKKLERGEAYPNGFYLRNIDNTLCLRGYKADGFDNWPGTNEFVFVRGEVK